MKKIIMTVALLSASTSFGMQNPAALPINDQTLPTMVQQVEKTIEDAKNGQLSVDFDKVKSDSQARLQEQGININRTTINALTGGDVYRHIDTAESLKKEGQCWFCLKRILQPVGIFLDASNVVLASIAASMVKSNQSAAQSLTIVIALMSAGAGAISVWVNKMKGRLAEIDNALDQQEPNA